MRVGFAAAAPAVASRLRSVIAPYPLGIASLAAAGAYLNGGEATARYEFTLRAQERRSLDAIALALQPYARALWRGTANFLLADLGERAQGVADRLAAAGIAVRSFDDPDLRGCLRICAAGDAATSELCERLAEGDAIGAVSA